MDYLVIAFFRDLYFEKVNENNKYVLCDQTFFDLYLLLAYSVRHIKSISFWNLVTRELAIEE